MHRFLVLHQSMNELNFHGINLL